MESQLQSHTPRQGMERGNITFLYLPPSDSTNNGDLSLSSPVDIETVVFRLWLRELW